MSVQQAEIAFLQLLKQLPGAKPVARTKPPLSNLILQGVNYHLESESVFVWFQGGYESYAIKELSQTDLKLLQRFMLQRLSEAPRSSLAEVERRKGLEGRAVIFQHSTFSPQIPGQLVSHAIDNSYTHLGNCWLVRSGQQTQYLPAQYLYLVPQYENVTPFPVY